MNYLPRRTLPFSVEFIRQFRRRRTLVAYGLMVLLPLLVVAAVKFGNSNDEGAAAGGNFGSGTLNLIGLATAGAANFTVVMIFFATGFLLTVVFALFAGDTVASEASWSSLRYLLAAPVPRRKLLSIKLAVALTLNLIALLILIAASYLIGLLAFGASPLISPIGGTFSSAEGFLRLAVIGTYVFVTLLFVSSVAFYMSVRTDVPLGAVGTAVILVILFAILDAISALGELRKWLPGHYSQAWTDALGAQITWDNMAKGATSSIILFSILVGLAYLKFERKDIMS